MNRKKVEKLRMISFVCIAILVCEFIYVGYHLFYRNETSVYFEGINAITVNDKEYITVGSNNDNAHFYEKAKISIYDLNRVKTFEKLYNVGYNSSFFGVVKDGDAIVAIGSYEKTEEQHKESVRSALIVKYDKEGNIIFESDFGMLDNSKFTSIVVGEDAYYVTGQTIYRNTKIGNKEGGAVLAKYSKEGELLWFKTYGSNKSAIFNDLLMVDGYLYTVGIDHNYMGVIAKYDLEGNIVSSNGYKVTDSLGFSDIVNANGSLYVCGALHRENENNDALIVRYDYNCGYMDQVIYTGAGMERFNKMIVDDQDHLVVIGTMAVAQEKSGISEYNYDGILAKYDLNLKYIAATDYGTDRDDFFNDILFQNDEYVIVGYSFYDNGSYMSKFIRYSKALKVLGVE